MLTSLVTHYPKKLLKRMIWYKGWFSLHLITEDMFMPSQNQAICNKFCIRIDVKRLIHFYDNFIYLIFVSFMYTYSFSNKNILLHIFARASTNVYVNVEQDLLIPCQKSVIASNKKQTARWHALNANQPTVKMHPNAFIARFLILCKAK